VMYHDPEQIKRCVESGDINFNGSVVDLAGLELIWTVLSQRGEITILGVGGVIPLTMLGAYLIGIVKDAPEIQKMLREHFPET